MSLDQLLTFVHCFRLVAHYHFFVLAVIVILILLVLSAEKHEDSVQTSACKCVMSMYTCTQYHIVFCISSRLKRTLKRAAHNTVKSFTCKCLLPIVHTSCLPREACLHTGYVSIQ